MRIGAVILGLVAAGLMAMGPARAQNADNMLDLAYSTFLDRPGWEHFDVEKLKADTKGKFADVAMGPLEQALLYVNTMEPDLRQARTLLRYGQVTTERDGKPAVIGFIEVDRYNLGTSDVPHVAWRFDFQPGSDGQPEVRNALRRAIPPEEAVTTDCLVAECLEHKVSTDGSFAWKPIAAPAGGWASPEASAARLGGAASALAVGEMAVALNIAAVEDGTYRWRGPEQPEAVTDGSPFLFFLEDQGVAGEGKNDAIMGMIRLNDHAISEIWTRRTDGGTQAIDWQQASVARAGAP